MKNIKKQKIQIFHTLQLILITTKDPFHIKKKSTKTDSVKCCLQVTIDEKNQKLKNER